MLFAFVDPWPWHFSFFLVLGLPEMCNPTRRTLACPHTKSSSDPWNRVQPFATFCFQGASQKFPRSRRGARFPLSPSYTSHRIPSPTPFPPLIDVFVLVCADVKIPPDSVLFFFRVLMSSRPHLLSPSQLSLRSAVDSPARTSPSDFFWIPYFLFPVEFLRIPSPYFYARL